ncbi:MAG: DnaB-like helicase C-terminal domain-containing protein [bacterium]
MSIETTEFLEHKIYPRIDVSKIFNDLTGFTQIEKGFRANCPNCGDKKQHFYIYRDRPFGFCYRCDYRITIWDHLKERYDLTQQETLRKLCELAGVPLPKDTQIDFEELNMEQGKTKALEKILEICQKKLEESEEAKLYLKQRGFSLEDASKFGLGFYSEGIKEEIEKIGCETISSDEKTRDKLLKSITSKMWTNRIIGLWRDRAGRVLTIWGRTIFDEEPKYCYLSGEPKSSPFGIDRIKRKDEVIIVEGIFDALTLIKNKFDAVAIGGNVISEEQIKSLVKSGIRTITLNLDNDEQGFNGTDINSEKLEAAGIKTYVISPDELGGVKDPDIYLRTNKVEDYEKLLDKAKSSAEWKIDYLAKTCDKGTAKGRDIILSKGIEFLNTVQDSISYEEGIKHLSLVLSVDKKSIENKCSELKDKKVKEELKTTLLKSIKEVQEKISDNKIEESERLLENGLYMLKSKKSNERVEFFNWDRLLQEGRSYSCQGKETGIVDLDRVVKIMPKELVILGARPGHGKSSFAYNLYLNFLENNPNETYIFCNMDVSSTVLMSRLATIKVKKDTDKSHSYKNVLSCFQSGKFAEEVKDAFEFFKRCGEERHLAIVNKPSYTVEQLIGYAEILSKESKPIGAIFIDYMELIGSSMKHPNEELRVSYIVNQLRIASERLNTPIIVLAQMNRANIKDSKKPENRLPTLAGLRYSGRQEQEATTVLGLFNIDVERIEAEQEEDKKSALSSKDTILEIIPLKNRGGETNKRIKVNFDMVSGYISNKKSGFGK